MIAAFTLEGRRFALAASFLPILMDENALPLLLNPPDGPSRAPFRQPGGLLVLRFRFRCVTVTAIVRAGSVVRGRRLCRLQARRGRPVVHDR